MPVTIKKTPSGYSVSTPHGTTAKGTTKAKAKAQERLLNAMEHSPEFRKKMQLKHNQQMSG